MADTLIEIEAEESPNGGRFRPGWVLGVLLQPRRTFKQIAAHDNGIWLLPLLIVSAAVIAFVLVRAPLARELIISGQVDTPPDFQYWSPEQQAQFLRAREATSGPAFIYVFPALLGLARVWAGWLIVGALLHLVLTLLGSRGTASSVMNVVAWSGLPFAVRDLLRAVYVAASHRLIASPGLAGFAPPGELSGAMALGQLLALIDIYWLWHLVLLYVGLRVPGDVSKARTLAAMLVVQIVAIALQMVPGLISAQMRGLTIIRPFF